MDTLTAPTGTQAIDRAARILTYVLEGEGRMTVGALSEAANLPKSTTSRLVGALERQGLLRRDLDDGSLQAGPAIDAYARRARLDPDMPNIARDLLESIATVTGETATLSIPTSKGVDQIAQAEGAYPGPLEALTPKTLTVRGDLVRDLEKTRQRGWGISIEEIEPGLVAIGAPVRGPDLRVITGIALAGPSMRITPDRYEQIGELLIRSAAELTVRLSHHHLEEGAA
ncbi:MAG: IclR family transcriptional regulator [Actinobacteria bacterium]|nr:IclR family transcriptional regulator [Actinomycetota bacterium]